MDPSLASLFVAAFLSSTLLPGGSELGLAWLAAARAYSPVTLLAVAGLGNTLGGMTSWGVGRLIAVKYPARESVQPSHRQALQRIERWGSPVLLLSWLPVIGDPLCVAAGWLRIHWLTSLLFIGLGKTLRYAVIVFLLNQGS
jgi:membrane protein YqaA with SNARE-associated domain